MLSASKDNIINQLVSRDSGLINETSQLIAFHKTIDRHHSHHHHHSWIMDGQQCCSFLLLNIFIYLESLQKKTVSVS